MQSFHARKQWKETSEWWTASKVYHYNIEYGTFYYPQLHKQNMAMATSNVPVPVSFHFKSMAVWL